VTVETTVTTVTTSMLGTDDGTTLDGTITIDGELGIVTISDDGTDVTTEAGTTTGLVNDDGTTDGETVAGGTYKLVVTDDGMIETIDCGMVVT
jgi:hypothetical protein